MLKSTNRIFITFVCLLSSGLLAATADSQNQQSTVEKLADITPALLEEAHIPGLSIAYIQNNDIKWQAALGVTNTATHTKVTPQTRFEAASLSKPVLAYIVMRFVSRGELTLDTPLHTILTHPRIKHAKYAKQLTPRLLLSHQSGLPNWGRETLEFSFAPGEAFNYSGEGYVYLQQILETLSGLDYQSLAQKEVFTPLNMQHSAFTWTQSDSFPLAQGHSQSGEPVDRGIPKANAASSLHTTASDYARFLQAWLAQPEWLKPALQTEVWLTGQVRGANTSVVKEKNLGWALGLGVQVKEQHNIYWHWGDNGEFRAFVALSPDTQTAIVYFANSQNGLAISKRITESVFGELDVMFDWLQYGQSDSPGWQDLYQGFVAESKQDYKTTIDYFTQVIEEFPENDRIRNRITWLKVLIDGHSKSVTLSANQLKEYPGKYGSRQIIRQGNNLVYQRAGNTPHPLTPITANLFAVGDLFDFRLEVVTDSAGKPTKLIGHYINGYQDESPAE